MVFPSDDPFESSSSSKKKSAQGRISPLSTLNALKKFQKVHQEKDEKEDRAPAAKVAVPAPPPLVVGGNGHRVAPSEDNHKEESNHHHQAAPTYLETRDSSPTSDLASATDSLGDEKPTTSVQLAMVPSSSVSIPASSPKGSSDVMRDYLKWTTSYTFVVKDFASLIRDNVQEAQLSEAFRAGTNGQSPSESNDRSEVIDISDDDHSSSVVSTGDASRFYRLKVFPNGWRSPGFVSIFVEFVRDPNRAPNLPLPPAALAGHKIDYRFRMEFPPSLEASGYIPQTLLLGAHLNEELTGVGQDRGVLQLVSHAELLEHLVWPDGSARFAVDIRPSIPYSFLSKVTTGMVGIINQGATCYLNSLLQNLFHTRALRKAVYEVDTSKDVAGEGVVLELQRLFAELQRSSKPVSTKDLTRAFGWADSQLIIQQDVQELLRELLDKLESRMTVNDSNPIKALFSGTTKSYIKCLNVPYESSREEPFYDIQLDVQGLEGVEQSFEKYVSQERLHGANQYDADQYGKQDADKGVIFTSMPPVLHLHLKRFEFDPRSEMFRKVNQRYAFPVILDLNKYVEPKDADAAVDQVYVLHSVLVHQGDERRGHYYAFCNTAETLSEMALEGTIEDQDEEDLMSNSDFSRHDACEFYRFDDERVSRSNREEAVERMFGAGVNKGRGGNSLHSNALDGADHYHDSSLSPSSQPASGASAYMLVYVRKQDWSTIMKRPVPDEPPASLLRRMEREVEERHRLKLEKERKQRIVTSRVSLLPKHLASTLGWCTNKHEAAPSLKNFAADVCRWGSAEGSELVVLGDHDEVTTREASEIVLSHFGLSASEGWKVYFLDYISASTFVRPGDPWISEPENEDGTSNGEAEDEDCTLAQATRMRLAMYSRAHRSPHMEFGAAAVLRFESVLSPYAGPIPTLQINLMLRRFDLRTMQIDPTYYRAMAVEIVPYDESDPEDAAPARAELSVRLLHAFMERVLSEPGASNLPDIRLFGLLRDFSHPQAGEVPKKLLVRRINEESNREFAENGDVVLFPYVSEATAPFGAEIEERLEAWTKHCNMALRNDNARRVTVVFHSVTSNSGGSGKDAVWEANEMNSIKTKDTQTWGEVFKTFATERLGWAEEDLKYGYLFFGTRSPYSSSYTKVVSSSNPTLPMTKRDVANPSGSDLLSVPIVTTMQKERWGAFESPHLRDDVEDGLHGFVHLFYEKLPFRASELGPTSIRARFLVQTPEVSATKAVLSTIGRRDVALVGDFPISTFATTVERLVATAVAKYGDVGSANSEVAKSDVAAFFTRDGLLTRILMSHESTSQFPSDLFPPHTGIPLMDETGVRGRTAELGPRLVVQFDLGRAPAVEVEHDASIGDDRRLYPRGCLLQVIHRDGSDADYAARAFGIPLLFTLWPGETLGSFWARLKRRIGLSEETLPNSIEARPGLVLESSTGVVRYFDEDLSPAAAPSTTTPVKRARLSADAFDELPLWEDPRIKTRLPMRSVPAERAPLVEFAYFAVVWTQIHAPGAIENARSTTPSTQYRAKQGLSIRST